MNKIKKWGKLEQKEAMINSYDFGGILSSTIGGAATGTTLLPGWGTAIGAGVGLIGGLMNNKQQKEQARQQKQMMNQQLMQQKQANLLALPQSSGGIGNSIPVFSEGGYLTPEILAKSGGYVAKSGIHIKPENRGKFTATKERTGKSTEELTHSKNPLTRKRAIFAQNAKRWKHDDGGYLGMQEFALGGPGDPIGGQGLGKNSTVFTPSNKTQWYPESAALSKYKSLIGSGKSDEANKLIFGYYSNEPYGPYKEGTHDEYTKTGKIRPIRANDLSTLDTNKYVAPKDYTALLQGINSNAYGGDVDGEGNEDTDTESSLKETMLLKSKYNSLNRKETGNKFETKSSSNQNKKLSPKEELKEYKRLKDKYSKFKNDKSSLRLDIGGYLDAIYKKAYGGSVTGFPWETEKAVGGFVNSLLPDTSKLISYKTGGTHEQNPLGGIPLSMSANGKRNTVEQGETSFKFKEGKYIFSNRLRV